MDMTDEAVLASADPQTALSRFWTWWRIRVRPRLAEVPATADASRAVALKAAEDQLGVGDPAVVTLRDLYGQSLAADLAARLN
jgi:hypothetical protein